MAGKSVNKVILLGNLGKDPEVKYTPQGTAVAKITLATNERFKGKDGQWQDRTEWHNVVLWQRLAEIADLNIRNVQRIEAGELDVLLTTAVRIRKALGCPLERLVPKDS